MPIHTIAKSLGVVTYPPGATFGPRNMLDFEFVWVIQGNVEYHVDDTMHTVGRDSIVLCKPSTRDFFQWDRKRPTRHAYVHFEIQDTPDKWPQATHWPVAQHLIASSMMLGLFRQIISPGSAAMTDVTSAVVGAMLGLFVSGAAETNGVEVPEYPDAVNRAWAFMLRTLDRDPSAVIDLTAMADAGCVTPEHLCRVFKKTLSLTPARAVLLSRLDRAAQLLARSNLGVAEIASLCGFASAFHFSRRFSEAFTISPRTYRNQIQAGATPPVPRLLQTHLSIPR